MNLPRVKGWIIDFRTARSIFQSGSNANINHCVESCINGDLACCHWEEDLFRKDPALKAAFLDHNCVCVPDSEIMKNCLNISNTKQAKKRLPNDDGAIFITAIAISRKYGVISDHKNLVFTTVYDHCKHYGVPILTAAEYFSLL